MNPWFRFYSETLGDRKLNYIVRVTGKPKAVIMGVWVTILALANDSPIPGALYLTEDLPVDDDELRRQTGLDGELDIIIDKFVDMKMLTADDKLALVVVNWNKRQFKSDNSTDRVKRHRQRQKEQQETKPETLPQRFSNLPDTEADTETKTDTKTEQDISSASADPPSPTSKPFIEMMTSDGVPNPDTLTIKDVKALTLSDKQWGALLQAEKLGKNRSGVRRFIKTVLEKPPAAVEVYRRICETYPAKALWPTIAQTVTDLELWERVLVGWLGCGYRAGNINALLEWYGQGKTSNGTYKGNGAPDDGKWHLPGGVT